MTCIDGTHTPELAVLQDERDLPVIGLSRYSNEELVRLLHNDALAKHLASFEYRVYWNGTAISQQGGHVVRFEAKFVDLRRFEVCCTMSEVRMRRYPRGNAVVSMLLGRTFVGLEAFAAACHNALGGNEDSVPLDGRIYVYTEMDEVE